jgi:hypothetical protein
MKESERLSWPFSHRQPHIANTDTKDMVMLSAFDRYYVASAATNDGNILNKDTKRSARRGIPHWLSNTRIDCSPVYSEEPLRSIHSRIHLFLRFRKYNGWGNVHRRSDNRENSLACRRRCCSGRHQ